MVVITHKSIREYSQKHSEASKALMDWLQKTQEANWSNINDVRATFGYADHVGGERVVFNIRGNHFRLVTAIVYETRTVYIKFIGTHEEYNHINAETVSLY
jgi:mRNA interferase HigB